MNIEQAAAVATEIAKRHAFEYAGNYGRGVFVHEVKVWADSDRLYFESGCNAKISQDKAREMLETVYRETADILIAACATAFVLKQQKRPRWRVGFWHMGTFHTNGFRRGLRFATESVAA